MIHDLQLIIPCSRIMNDVTHILKSEEEKI